MQASWRPVAILLALACVTLGAPTSASAAGVSHGWWSQTHAASAVLDSDVPADGLLVQRSPAGDIAVAAVHGAGPLHTLTVPLVGTPVLTSPVRACRLTGAFSPEQGGAWADRPPFDCVGAVSATLRGSTLTFALSTMQTAGVVLQATGESDRVAFGAPAVVLEEPPPAGSRSSVGTPDRRQVSALALTPLVGPVRPLPVASSFQTPEGVSLPAPTPAIALQSAPDVPVLSVTPRSVSGGSTRTTAATAVALALLLALLLYWSEGFGAAMWRTQPLLRRPLTVPINEVSMTQPDLPELIRHEVRRQLAAGPRRYAPLAASVVALLALVVLVPDVHPNGASSNLNGALGGTGGVAPGTATGGSPGTTSGTLPGATSGLTNGGTGGSGTAGTTGSAGSTGGASTGTSTGGTSAGIDRSSTSTTRGVVPQPAGTAVNGTKCGPGIRQFTFTPYSPMCIPHFTGNNGGATAHGVTKSTITFVLRNPSDYEAARSAVAASSFAAGLHDTQVLVDVFNKQFELYGRKVVLKTFTGRGSFIAEAAGQDQAGASADAQQAYDLGAFASGIPPDPQVYQNALSSRGVISFGLDGVGTIASSRTAYPYQYQSLGPVADFQAIGMSDLICGRMAKMPAVFAGDPLLAKKNRTFGLILSQQAATAQGGTNELPSLVKSRCGETVRTYTYQGNTANNASDAANIATRAKADGITTLVLVTDLLFGPTMTSAAVQQSYQPEWLVPKLNRNQTARQMDSTAVKNMIFAHPWKAQSFPADKGGCYQIYKLGDPTGEPQSDQIAGATFDSLCSLLLEFFGALQTAGPQLSPTTFGQGFFSMPPSAGPGDFGTWSYAKDHYSPDSTYTLQYWKPTGDNPYDGGTGSYLNCLENANIPYVGATLGSGQLRCLGR